MRCINNTDKTNILRISCFLIQSIKRKNFLSEVLYKRKNVRNILFIYANEININEIIKY